MGCIQTYFKKGSYDVHEAHSAGVSPSSTQGLEKDNAPNDILKEKIEPSLNGPPTISIDGVTEKNEGSPDVNRNSTLEPNGTAKLIGSGLESIPSKDAIKDSADEVKDSGKASTIESPAPTEDVQKQRPDSGAKIAVDESLGSPVESVRSQLEDVTPNDSIIASRGSSAVVEDAGDSRPVSIEAEEGSSRPQSGSSLTEDVRKTRSKRSVEIEDKSGDGSRPVSASDTSRPSSEIQKESKSKSEDGEEMTISSRPSSGVNKDVKVDKEEVNDKSKEEEIIVEENEENKSQEQNESANVSQEASEATSVVESVAELGKENSEEVNENQITTQAVIELTKSQEGEEEIEAIGADKVEEEEALAKDEGEKLDEESISVKLEEIKEKRLEKSAAVIEESVDSLEEVAVKKESEEISEDKGEVLVEKEEVDEKEVEGKEESLEDVEGVKEEISEKESEESKEEVKEESVEVKGESVEAKEDIEEVKDESTEGKEEVKDESIENKNEIQDKEEVEEVKDESVEGKEEDKKEAVEITEAAKEESVESQEVIKEENIENEEIVKEESVENQEEVKEQIVETAESSVEAVDEKVDEAENQVEVKEETEGNIPAESQDSTTEEIGKQIKATASELVEDVLEKAEANLDPTLTSAATTIQATFRGFQTRQALKKLADKDKEEQEGASVDGQNESQQAEKETISAPEETVEDSSLTDITGADLSLPTDIISELDLPPPPPIIIEDQEQPSKDLSNQFLTLEEMRRPQECDELPEDRGESQEGDSAGAQHEAASKIQAGVRGFLTRKQMQKNKLQILDVEKIDEEQGSGKPEAKAEEYSVETTENEVVENSSKEEVKSVDEEESKRASRSSTIEQSDELPPPPSLDDIVSMEKEDKTESAEDEEVWNTLKSEMEKEIIATNLSIQRIKRETAIEEVDGGVKEAAALVSEMRHTGEFHDVLLPLEEKIEELDGEDKNKIVGRMTSQGSATAPNDTTPDGEVQDDDLTLQGASQDLEVDNNTEEDSAINFQDPCVELEPEEEMKTAENAATKIQAGFRGYKVRKQIKDGAVTKKNGPRKHSASKVVSEDIISPPASQAEEVDEFPEVEKEPEKNAKEEDAATKIQASFRGYKTRKDMKTITK